jgi:hypothetical protein
MGAFDQGVATAEAQNEKNPFNLILGKFQESQARRYKEDSDRKKEEAELSKALQVLSYQKNYESELQKAKAEEERAQIGVKAGEERKSGLLESVRKGEVAPTEETGTGTFEGTPFGMVGQRYKTGESPDLALKQENLKYMQNINKRLEGEGADLVYRRADTGEEVTKEEAESAIANGDRNFLINQRITTKAGVRETPLIKSPDLTKDEKEYMVASKRIVGSVDDLLGRFDKMFEKKGSAGWKQAQVQSLPFFAIGDQDLQYFKSSLNKLKGDIPFLRGGKQLTPMEAKRVDVLLNPFGKTKDTYQRDLETFKNEFTSGAEIMVGGVSALSKQKAQGNNPEYQKYLKSIGQ